MKKLIIILISCFLCVLVSAQQGQQQVVEVKKSQGGGLSTVQTSSPITGDGKNTSISIPVASSSVNGYLSKQSFTKFNNDSARTNDSIVALRNRFNGKYSGLPSQTNNSGKYLTTNGTNESWADLVEPIVTPGNRTRAGVVFCDTFYIPKDTILAGCNKQLIRTYGADTTVVIHWMSINYKYKTAAYTSTGTDSMFLTTKQNGLTYKVLYLDDSYLITTYSGVGFFPIAVDKKDQGAAFRFYVPHIYTVGSGNLWLRVKYYLVVRKLT